MNNQPGQPPMNGNDDLVKTLNEGLQFEETPMPGTPPSLPTPPPIASDTPAPDDDTKDNMVMPSLDPSAGDPDNEPFSPPTMGSTPPPIEPPKEDKSAEEDKPAPKPDHHQKHDKPTHSGKDGDLDGIKASALEALRPLVGKLKLPAEERFDTLLLIIRSTDDQSLLNQAHDAAKEISDDTRRAQALLDVIKEIDYFSSKR